MAIALFTAEAQQQIEADKAEAWLAGMLQDLEGLRDRLMFAPDHWRSDLALKCLHSHTMNMIGDIEDLQAGYQPVRWQ